MRGNNKKTHGNINPAYTSEPDSNRIHGIEVQPTECQITCGQNATGLTNPTCIVDGNVDYTSRRRTSQVISVHDDIGGAYEMSGPTVVMGQTDSTTSSVVLDDLRANNEESIRQQEQSMPNTPELTQRMKVFVTVCCMLVYGGVGLLEGALGPALLDLAILTGSTIRQISFVFTAKTLCSLVANLGLAPVFQRINGNFILSGMSVFGAIMVVSAMWSMRLIPFMVLMSFTGLYAVTMTVGSFFVINRTWKEKAAPVFQLLTLFYCGSLAAGSVLVGPFLVTTNTSTEHQHCLNATDTNSSLTTSSPWDFTSAMTEQPNIPPTEATYVSESTQTFVNSSSIVSSRSITATITYRPAVLSTQSASKDDETITVARTNENIPDISMSKNGYNETSPTVVNTKVQYVFMIISAHILFCGLLMGASLVIIKYPIKMEPVAKDTEEKENNTEPSIIFRVTMSASFAMFMCMVGGLEVGYPGFLLTFVVDYLGWTKAAGVWITFVFLASGLVGTALKILLARYFQPQTLLLMDSSVCVLSTLALCIFVKQHDIVMWVCSACIGATHIGLNPESYAWVDSFMGMTALTSALYWCGFYVGGMSFPPIIGYMVDKGDPMGYLYMMLCIALATMAATLFFMVVVKRSGRQQANTVRGLFTRYHMDAHMHLSRGCIVYQEDINV